MKREPLVLVLAVGMTPRWLPYAPRMARLAKEGWSVGVREVIPAVTCTAQATLLTGKTPREHGIVANGWLFRETREIRFWQQSNHLLQAEPLYSTLRRRNPDLRVAKLFWWFNQGAAVDFSVTPKPHYGADGNKAFGISGKPLSLAADLERELGAFPFASFWGPMAGLPATEWIARSAAKVLNHQRPDLTLIYLPHLDYNPQRFGPSGCDMAREVGQLDTAMEPLFDACQRTGARMWVVSEYGHVDVSQPILLNRWLRERDWLVVRDGPFGETLETFQSEAFAVVDHQIAHVYVRNPDRITALADALRDLDGVVQGLAGEERAAVGLDHPRSGEIVLLAKPNAWFAYPFWLDEARAPDFAPTIDIHRKPGFDPCEMFFDPNLRWPQGRAALRLIQKKLGFRTLFDVVATDATLVRGSHGLPAVDPADRPLLIASQVPSRENVCLTDVRSLVLEYFDSTDP